MQAHQILANQRWPNDRKRIWLVRKHINRTWPDELSFAKSKIMGSKGHDFATRMINGRLKTRFKNKFVWGIDHEISGNKHQGRMYHSPLFDGLKGRHSWQAWLKALRRKNIFSPWPGRLWIGACLTTKRRDWGDDQAADHPPCATFGEYYGIISPGLQMELYL